MNQDYVEIVKRAARVIEHNDMATLTDELRLAEYDGFKRGFKVAEVEYEKRLKKYVNLGLLDLLNYVSALFLGYNLCDFLRWIP